MTGNRVALITGCSSGVGLFTAVRLAQAGHRVVATMRNLGKQQALLETAARAGVSLDVRALDVTEAASIDSCVAGVMADFGRIDLLVNNAGAGIHGSLEQTSDADLRWLMEVNFFGVWNLTKAAVPHMREAGGGRIVTVTSSGGLIGMPFNDAYCAAKFATEGMMEAFASVALPMGIKVCMIEPGPVLTEFLANAEVASAAFMAGLEPPYDRMARNYLALSGQSFAAQGQTADELAEIVVNVAEAAEPPFRTLTGEGTKAMAAAKCADLTSSRLVENFAKILAG